MQSGRFAAFKPWQPYDEQLNVLIARGLQVSDRPKALDYLARLGYYRLSGYWYPLRALSDAPSTGIKDLVRSSKFVENSRFEEVVNLYIFDKKLRLLAIDALERIEMALRVDVAYLLGRYDPLAHKKVKYLHGHFAKQVKTKGPAKGQTEHALWLKKYDAQLRRVRKKPFIAHNMKKYGELPIWVAIEVWDFGLLSKMYAGMREHDQNAIARRYGASSGRELASWLRSFNFIRNVSAHHGRLWNINVLERAPIPVSEPSWQAFENERPFLYFCLMHKMLQAICPNSSWGSRFATLLREEFPKNKCLQLKSFGISAESDVQMFLQRHK